MNVKDFSFEFGDVKHSRDGSNPELRMPEILRWSGGIQSVCA
jgi:hypothetical protein